MSYISIRYWFVLRNKNLKSTTAAAYVRKTGLSITMKYRWAETNYLRFLLDILFQVSLPCLWVIKEMFTGEFPSKISGNLYTNSAYKMFKFLFTCRCINLANFFLETYQPTKSNRRQCLVTFCVACSSSNKQHTFSSCGPTEYYRNSQSSDQHSWFVQAIYLFKLPVERPDTVWVFIVLLSCSWKTHQKIFFFSTWKIQWLKHY